MTASTAEVDYIGLPVAGFDRGDERETTVFLAAAGVAAVVIVLLDEPNTDKQVTPTETVGLVEQDMGELHAAALDDALRSNPCGAPLAVYRLGLGGIWTVDHEDGQPPRVQVERLLDVRAARPLVERAERAYARNGVDTLPLNMVLRGC